MKKILAVFFAIVFILNFVFPIYSYANDSLYVWSPIAVTTTSSINKDKR